MCEPRQKEAWHSVEGRQEGVVTGGKGHGKLTATTISKLDKYYVRAIRSHPNDLEGMRNAGFASFLYALNPNESLHSVIWRKCLKTDFLGKLRVEAGSTIAVSEFNQGMKKVKKV